MRNKHETPVDILLQDRGITNVDEFKSTHTVPWWMTCSREIIEADGKIKKTKLDTYKW